MEKNYWGHFSSAYSLALSPIGLIGDTLNLFRPDFVAYRAYWRHFELVSNRFCRLSGLLATL
ncbi:hypothetical protein J2Y67_005710 [Neobacillus niacini]|nr:hypothetical protein [Neobacillus niacini]